MNFIKIKGEWYLKSSKYSYKPKLHLNENIERVCLYSVIDAESKKEYKSLGKIASTLLSDYKSNFEDDFWGNMNFIPIPEQIRKQMK